MKSSFLILCAALVILSFACKEEVQVYRIGAVIPTSGAFDAYGRNVKNGMILALDEVNQQGIKGKKMDILIEDDASEEKKAVEKANQLIGNGIPVLIGGVTSNEALAMAPVCEAKKVVLISPTATSPKLTGIGQYFFRTFPSDTLEGRVMAEYAIRRMKIRTIAILYIDKEYGQGITNVFKDRFQQLGGTVIYEKAYPEGSTDFKPMVAEIKTANPDGVYLPGYYTEIAVILKEIKAQELNLKKLSVQGMATPVFLEIVEDAGEGVVYPQPPYNPTSNDPAIQKFVSAYKAKFPTEPDVDAAFAYDAIKVIAKAIEGCTQYPKDLRSRIADTNYRGVTGEITFNAGGDVDITPLMYQVKDGKFVPIQ
jgi:branched-chain amino acid transport system substrate-binding protein